MESGQKSTNVCRSVYHAMMCNNVIYKLCGQQVEFPIGLSYRIFKLKKQLDELEEMMRGRWDLLFGKGYDTEKFTDEQIILYNSTLQASVEIDTFGITTEEIASNKNVKLSVQDIECLDNFLQS